MAKRNFGDEFGFQTRAVHTGNDVDSETGAIKRPITMANSYDPLPNHRSGVAFGGFPTGLDTGSRPVCYPTRVATHSDATGRLFTVQTRKGARSAGRRNKLKRKLSSGITDKIIKHRTY